MAAIYGLKICVSMVRFRSRQLPEPDGRIVHVTYDALVAAWRRICLKAGIEDLHLHDLRHTAATRMAIKTGNVFLVKALTEHKTLAMLQRRVNVKASDVVAVMHAASPMPSTPSTPSTPSAAPPVTPETVAAPDVVTQNSDAATCEGMVGNVVRANFGRGRAA